MWSSQTETENWEHQELMDRLRKTLYYGGLKMPRCKVFTKPLSDLVAEEVSSEIDHIKASPCSLILALIYLDLLKELDPAYLNRVPPSDVLLVAMLISTKYHSGYDEDIYLADWAEYGHTTVDRLRAMELEFLAALEWNVYVSKETFFAKLRQIEHTLATREMHSRQNALTYTELCTLMPTIDAVCHLINYSCLLAVSYAAGLLAICSAFFVATQVPGSYLYESTQPSPSVVTNGTSSENILTDGGECGPSGCSPAGTNMTELEQRLILNGVEWKPVASADDDSQRINLNGGTDYRTTVSVSWPVVSNDSVLRLDADSWMHIRLRENDSGVDISEWSPYKTTPSGNDLSFLSYLWLKFL